MQRDTDTQRSTQHKGRQVFTASEVAEYEYCPLAWWYARYEPHVDIDTEELFAELVEMEQAHGSQAPALPEYQFIEQLLLQRGAFEEGRQQHSEHAGQVAAMSDLEELAEERQGKREVAGPLVRARTLVIILGVLTILCLGMAFLFASH